jgi:hypothetical protein
MRTGLFSGRSGSYHSASCYYISSFKKPLQSGYDESASPQSETLRGGASVNHHDCNTVVATESQ